VVLAGLGPGIGADGAAASTANTVPASALGPFVGYRWFGAPHSISAQWRVPRILQSSEAHASTWIGLQGESGAFIQIGTTEDVWTGQKDLPNGAYYSGFWSDDEVGFRPQPTFPAHVRPGDLMTASIAETTGGWRVQLVDARNHLSLDRTISMGTTDVSEAEWHQEDPTDGATESPVPYPRLSPIRMTDLKVNGHPPQGGLDNQLWMSVPGQDFAPTGLKGDSFDVVPVHLNPAQVQWLSAYAPYGVAASKFDLEEAFWRSHPPPSSVARRELHPFLAALGAREQTLSSHSWPSVPQSDIDGLIAASRQDGAALTALANAEPKPGAKVIARLDQSRSDLRLAGQRVTDRMGLP
jgi:hypothetical protein